MTSRTKLTAALCAVASIALFTGYATFDQWSGFVLHLFVGP